MKGPLHHRDAEGAGGGGMFGDEGDAAGLAVEAVDDGNLAAVGEFEGEEVFEPVPEGGRSARHLGVDLEGGRFVHDHVILGFLEDGEIGIESGVGHAGP